MSSVVDPHENSVHSMTEPGPKMRIEAQSFRSGNGSFEVNIAWSPGCPTETMRPFTMIEWAPGEVVSNRTCTPGSTVSVSPTGTITSPATRYGLPARSQVVFSVSGPETMVGPAVAVCEAGPGTTSRTRIAKKTLARRCTLSS